MTATIDNRPHCWQGGCEHPGPYVGIMAGRPVQTRDGGSLAVPVAYVGEYCPEHEATAAGRWPV